MNRATPLEATVLGHGATLGDESGWAMPREFVGVAAEVDAIHSNVGVADVSHYAHFTLSGKNSVKFLQGLVTNDVAALAPHTGCFAAFLNVHGRIEAVAHVFAVGENDLVLQTPPEATEWVSKSLGRFRLAGGFDLTRLETAAALSVLGPSAVATLEAAIGASVDAPSPLATGTIELEGASLRLLGVPRGAPGFDVVGDAGAIASLWGRLVGAGATPVGAAALDVVRMEAGVARFAVDYDAETVLQEADVPGIVSMNKGCYLGQEIVARLHFLGQPSKLLRRLEVPGGELPEAGAEVMAAGDDAKVAGRVTSAVTSPTEGPIVFAVVKRKYYAEGTALGVRVGDRVVPATVRHREHASSVQETR